MKLYFDPVTVNCRKVLAGLDLIGAAFDEEKVDYFGGGHTGPEYTAINPNQSLPALIDDGFTVWESNAILRSLAKRTQRNTVWPEDQRQQTRIDGWMDWASLSLTPPLTRLRKVRAAGGEGELAAVIEAATLLDWQLGQSPFIAGDTLSLADIAAAPSVYRLGLLSAQEPHLPKLPHLLAYRETLETDPLYRLHIRDALT